MTFKGALLPCSGGHIAEGQLIQINLLRDQPGVKLGLLYPVKLIVTHNGNETTFTDPEESRHILNATSARDTTETCFQHGSFIYERLYLNDFKWFKWTKQGILWWVINGQVSLHNRPRHTFMIALKVTIWLLYNSDWSWKLKECNSSSLFPFLDYYRPDFLFSKYKPWSCMFISIGSAKTWVYISFQFT